MGRYKEIRQNVFERVQPRLKQPSNNPFESINREINKKYKEDMKKGS